MASLKTIPNKYGDNSIMVKSVVTVTVQLISCQSCSKHKQKEAVWRHE